MYERHDFIGVRKAVKCSIIAMHVPSSFKEYVIKLTGIY